jgi:hypothetical protein
MPNESWPIGQPRRRAMKLQNGWIVPIKPSSDVTPLCMRRRSSSLDAVRTMSYAFSVRCLGGPVPT